MTDALNATKAAVSEGVVCGGGIALLYASSLLDKLETDNEDQKVGVKIVQKAIKIPATAIISNAGKEGAVYCGKMLEQAKTPDSRYGYDLPQINGATYLKLVLLILLKLFALHCKMQHL